MTRTLLLTLLPVLPAAAAPLPEQEVQRLAAVRAYGAWTDPDGKCSFRVDGDTLRIRLGGYESVEHEAFPRLRSNAPKLLREVEGDFTVVVRVTCPPQPVEGISWERYVMGGLWVEDAVGNRALLRRSERMHCTHRVHFERAWWNIQGMRHGSPNGDDTATPQTSLRLIRTGPFVQFEYSWNGLDWHNYGQPEKLEWDRRVKVGLFAENTTGHRAEVVFDRYSLTQPKK